MNRINKYYINKKNSGKTHEQSGDAPLLVYQQYEGSKVFWGSISQTNQIVSLLLRDILVLNHYCIEIHAQ